MDDNLNISKTVEAWADIVLDRWLQKIDSMKVHESYELANSFTHEIVSSAAGNPQRIEFAFKYYGKFVDMGVGRGISLSEIGQAVSRRKTKKWYSPVIFSEVKKLAEMLAEKHGKLGALTIVENTDDNALLWEKQWLTI